MKGIICKSLIKLSMILSVIMLVAMMTPMDANSATIWSEATVPGTVDNGDGGPLELGVKFRSDINGYITGIRFYKADTNTGTHIGNLWQSDGTLLASATFTNETSSGWQQVNFSTPVAITANTVYVASYFCPNSHISLDLGYFASNGVDNPPLHALAEGESGSNGVLAVGADVFPADSFSSSNYWVDVVFETPSSLVVTPANQTITVGAMQLFTAIGVLPNGSKINLSGTPTWISSDTGKATISSTGIAMALSSGSTTITASLGSLSNSTGLTIAPDPGGPILVISSTSNPFSGYYAEILRNEGFNAFSQRDITLVTPSMLSSYDVVILGDMVLSAGQVTMLSEWVNAGGNLIAMRPDSQLAGLLGLTDTPNTKLDAYLKVANSGPGSGIVTDTIQYHGTADIYTLNGATSIATLYSDASTSTSNPAVTLKSVGSNGGHAAAFTYDLARSVVYTRQGNPAWAGQHRDGYLAVRSDDLFFGHAIFDDQPDWIDLNNVAIPQADEQQRLLANLILQMNFDRRPLPRFWYLPRKLSAAVVMTGYDHGYPTINGSGTAGRFDHYISLSQSGCSVDNWDCIRSTSFIQIQPPPQTPPLSIADALTYVNEGFEIGTLISTNCADWTLTSLDSFLSTNIFDWGAFYTNLPSSLTARMDCVVWSDYATMPKVELDHGIRLDTTYYYWPAEWVNNKPGFFTGSGMPMRFADANGNLINVYQAATQLTDESGQNYTTSPTTIDTLLDNATGSNGYYGVFTANAGNDTNDPDSDSFKASEAIVNSAITHSIPVVSARQMLQWLDGRNASSFSSISWDWSTLNFSISAGTGATPLTAMVPVPSGKTVSSITLDGTTPVSFTTDTIKGMSYARFTADSGAYQIVFAPSTGPLAPTATAATAITYNSFSANWGTVSGATGYRLDVATDSGFTTFLSGFNNLDVGNVLTKSVTGLTHATPYYYRVRAYNATGTSSNSGTITATTNKLDQTITFNVLSAKTYGASPFALTATASSGLTVSYTSSNTNVATVSGNTVTIVGAGTTAITASQAGDSNYNAATPVLRDLTVSPKALTVTGMTAANKVYDGNTTATLSGGTLVGIVSPDVVSINTRTGSFADKAVASGKPVTVSSVTLTGADAGNYSVTNPTGITASITALPLTVTGMTAANKVYDGNTSATLSGGTLAGVISPDVVSIATRTGSFADKLVGNNKPVTVSSVTLGGTDGGNYSVTNPTGITASITALPLTVTGMTAANKVYDRGTTATLSGGTLAGVISPDVVSINTRIGSFADKLVGNNKPVTVSSVTLGGTDGGNYSVTNPTGITASITALPLTVTGMTAADKVYDGNTSATLSGGTLVGVISPDVVSINTRAGSFANKLVGNNKPVTVSSVTLGGTDGGNYSVTNPTGITANITPKALTVTGMTAANKVYDGNTTATLASGTLVGVISPDVVSINTRTGSFANKTVADNKPVTVSSVTLGDTDGGNYTVTNPTGITASITALPLTVTGMTAADKVYDGNTTATLASGTLVGVISPDVVSINTRTGSFANNAVASGKPVTVSSVTLTGADGGNYSVTNPTGITASITALPLTVTADAKSKTYGAIDPALTYQITGGALVGTDTITGALSRAPGENVGDYAINQNTLTAGSNYNLIYTGANLTIGKALLTVTAADAGRAYGAANPAFTASYTGFVNSENSSVLSGSPSLTTDATVSSPVGTYQIVAAVGTLAADNYSFAFVNGTLTVGKASQTITFADIAPKVLGSADFDPGATASSGLAVTYTSSNESVATIEAGKVKLVGVGSATITAQQAGDGTYNAAIDLHQTLQVVVATDVKPALVSGNYYDHFLDAYLAAALSTSDGVIEARDFVFGESITLTAVKDITIRGGYDITYSNQTGYSHLKGLTVTNGSVVIDRVTID